MSNPLRRNRWIAFCGTLAGILILLTVKIFGWEKIALPWKCPVKYLLGYNCLGCAGTRATNALLHGDLLLAWWYHPLWVIALGIFALHWLDFCLNAIHPMRFSLCRWHWYVICRHPVGWSIVFSGIVVGFTLLRNFPFYQNFFFA